MANGARSAVGIPVADGIGRVSGWVNSYIVQEGEETYLIDTGFSRTAKPIVRAFERANVPLLRVGTVVLTHHHFDHRGGAAFLLDRTHAPIACHADDLPFVDGRTKAPMPFLLRLLARPRPAPVALPLKEGDRIGPFVVLHVPGHTPGEVALYHPARRILFSGDSVVEGKGRLTLPGRRFASDLAQAVDSLGRLRALEVELLLPGHGNPVGREFSSLLDDLIRRAPAEFLSASAR